MGDTGESFANKMMYPRSLRHSASQAAFDPGLGFVFYHKPALGVECFISNQCDTFADDLAWVMSKNDQHKN